MAPVGRVIGARHARDERTKVGHCPHEVRGGQWTVTSFPRSGGKGRPRWRKHRDEARRSSVGSRRHRLHPGCSVPPRGRRGVRAHRPQRDRRPAASRRPGEGAGRVPVRGAVEDGRRLGGRRRARPEPLEAAGRVPAPARGRHRPEHLPAVPGAARPVGRRRVHGLGRNALGRPVLAADAAELRRPADAASARPGSSASRTGRGRYPCSRSGRTGRTGASITSTGG